MQNPQLSLLSPNLLDLTDFFLDFAGYLVTGAFSFQLWIIAVSSPAISLSLPFTL